MTTEQLQRAIHSTPFIPFTIRVADGQEIRIPHPDMIMHPPNTRTAAVGLPDGTIEILDLLLITGLVIDQPADVR
jgi:hypothetical protein